MALLKRPVSPTWGRTSTAKKVSMASVGKYETGAIETKIAVAQPKVERPLHSTGVIPAAPVAEDVTEKKEKKVAKTKVDAKKPAEKAEVKSVAPAVAKETPAAKKEAVKKTVAAKKETAKKAVAEKKEAVKKTVAAKKETAAAKKEAVKKTAAAKKETAKKAVAEKKETVKKAVAAKKTAVKKTVAAKKETVKKAVAAKKSSSLFQIEYQGQNITADAIEERLAEICKNSGIKAKTVELYVKPEDNKVYAVVNGENIDFDLF